MKKLNLKGDSTATVKKMDYWNKALAEFNSLREKAIIPKRGTLHYVMVINIMKRIIKEDEAKKEENPKCLILDL